MSHAWRLPSVVLLVLPLLSLACGDGGPGGPASGFVVVTGTVVEFQDETPVDGGVTITVTTQGGEMERLFLAPFVEGPVSPPQETVNLYDLVRRVEVGDSIRAEGERTPAGVKLASLAILAGRP